MKFRFCGDLDCPDWVLSEIATLSKMTSVRMKVLVNQIIIYSVQRNFNYEKVLKLAVDNADGLNDIKGAIAACHFIVTNAAKHDLDDSSLVQEIQQLGLPKENAEALGRQYREHKDSIQDSLERESYRLSKLISTDWRIDCVLGTSKTVQLPSSTNSLIVPSSTSTLGSSNITSVDSELGLSVQLNIKYDTRPQDEDSNLLTDHSDRIKNIAFELAPEKLDILINELMNAIQIVDNLDG